MVRTKVHDNMKKWCGLEKSIRLDKLPCAEMETKQPSVCSSHTGHSLGNSTVDQRSIYLSVYLKENVS
jgi:hypothetical protein